MTTCTRPPAGWYCTRDAGHAGPCPTREATSNPSPALIAHYADTIRLIEGRIVARVPLPRLRFTQPKGLTEAEVLELALAFAHAHTIATQVTA